MLFAKKTELVPVLVAALVLAVAACSYTPALYCDENTPCEDPARPFCDLTGQYPASEGVGRTCIPVPFDAAVDPDGPDNAPDAAVADAPAWDAALASVTVNLAGNGNGAVVSAPFGINCGASCQASFEAGTTLTLTATPESDSTFTGWSGAGCTGTGTCVFDVATAGATVTATFALREYQLTVTRAGDGTGNVTSTGSGIDCGSDCTETYPHGTSVTLTAAATGASSFGGWADACAGLTTTCTLTMDSDKTASASFDLNSFTLGVSLAGTGGGTVVSDVGSINCPSGDCADSYSSGTLVELTASPDGTSTFDGWSGGCAGTNTTCQVTVTAATSVTATFTRITYALTVSKNSTNGGDGLVTSTPGGINCGGDCGEVYDALTVVALSQSPIGNAVFAGWTGSCTGSGTCNLTMDAAKSVTASFCAPRNCGALECGSVDDGCGGLMNCGTCCDDLTTHACVEEAPTDWSGPAIRWEAPAAETPSPCDADYPTNAGDYFYQLSATGSCSCSCEDATGMTCAPATIKAYGDFTCQTLSPDAQTLLFACIPLNSSMYDSESHIKFTDPTPSGGSCQEVASNDLTPPTFANKSRVCTGATSGGICTSAGQLCAPNAPTGWDGSLCIYRSGDHSCPAGSSYMSRYTRYSDYSDGRSCSTCSCGSVDGTCQGHLSFVEECIYPPTEITTGEPGQCINRQGATNVHYSHDPVGTCPHTGGDLTGAATPTNPITYCCLD